MWLLMIEALAALSLLVFIVWWTMFSGRKNDQRDQGHKNEPEPEPAERDTPER